MKTGKTTPTRPARHTPATDELAHPPQDTSAWSRRNVLAAGAIGAGAVVLGSTHANASAPTTAPARPPTATAPLSPAGRDDAVALLSPSDNRIMNRFSWGLNEGLVDEVVAAGGAGAWFESQLDPASIPDPVGDDINTWWPHLAYTPAKLWADDQGGGMQGFLVQDDFARWTFMRRMFSTRQVHEVMADFWSNLLHVPVPCQKAFPQRMRYDATIRANSLTTFSQLLTAAVLHPAMLCYLDNAKSTNTAPNENLGREVLELHTLGDTNYSELDVKNSMYILTGWGVDINATWEPYYSLTDHWVGKVSVLNGEFTSPNSTKDGKAVTYAYLDFLAKHQRTANAVAKALATRFAADVPTQALIDAVAKAYYDSKSDIKTTLRALVAHPDFLDGTTPKVRTPIEDLINTYRSMQITIKKPTADVQEGARVVLSESAGMGQRPFDWPRPDGFPDRDDAWTSAGRMLGSFKMHAHVGSGRFPKLGATFKPLDYWLPPLPAPFSVVVDHVCRVMLNQGSTAAELDAACKATGQLATDVIAADGALVKRGLTTLLLAALDSPLHMNR